MKIEELFKKACESCGCDDPNCGLLISSHCHPKAGTRVKFFRATGVLQVDCVVCDKNVMQIEVTPPSASTSAEPS